MNDLQVAKNALRVITEITNKMRNSDNWVNYGICGQVNSQMDGMFDYDMKYQVRILIKEITKSWPHYSGDATYPVPASTDGSDTREPGIAFTSACAVQDSKDALWSHGNAYGRARWRLLRYIRDTLNDKIENTDYIRYRGDNGESLGDILSAALNTHTNINANAATASENEQMNINTNINTSTLEGKIAVMQAALTGIKIQYRQHGDEEWSVSQGFSNADLGFHWGEWEYRIYQEPKTKDTFDFAGLNQKWKYAARDENGGLYLYDNHPNLSIASFHPNGDTRAVTDMFESYKIGNCNWKDSLISRDEVDSMR